MKTTGIDYVVQAGISNIEGLGGLNTTVELD